MEEETIEKIKKNKFIKIIHETDFKYFKYLVEDFVGIKDYKDEQGNGLVLYTIINRSYKFFKYLLDNDYNMDISYKISDIYFKPISIVAGSNVDYKIIQYYKDNGCNYDEYTLLYICLNKRYDNVNMLIEVLEYYKEYNININKEIYHDKTYLDIANINKIYIVAHYIQQYIET